MTFDAQVLILNVTAHTYATVRKIKCKDSWEISRVITNSAHVYIHISRRESKLIAVIILPKLCNCLTHLFQFKYFNFKHFSLHFLLKKSKKVFKLFLNQAFTCFCYFKSYDLWEKIITIISCHKMLHKLQNAHFVPFATIYYTFLCANITRKYLFLQAINLCSLTHFLTRKYLIIQVYNDINFMFKIVIWYVARNTSYICINFILIYPKLLL